MKFDDIQFTIEEKQFMDGPYLKIENVAAKKSWPPKEDAEEEPIEEEKEELEGKE